MKKIILGLLFISLLLAGCTDSRPSPNITLTSGGDTNDALLLRTSNVNLILPTLVGTASLCVTSNGIGLVFTGCGTGGGGKTYTGISPILVANDANTISISSVVTKLTQGTNITLSCTGSDTNGNCTINSTGGSGSYNDTNVNALLANRFPVADGNISSATRWNADLNWNDISALFPVPDANIVGGSWVRNSIFNAFYPVADSNITSVSSSKFIWDSNAVLDGRYAKTSDVNGIFIRISDANTSGRLNVVAIKDFNSTVTQLAGAGGCSTCVQNAIFNAFYPIADANISSATSWNARVQNAVFNAAFPIADANITAVSLSKIVWDNNANLDFGHVRSADKNMIIPTVSSQQNKLLSNDGTNYSWVSASAGGGSGRTYTSGTPATLQVNNDLNTLSQNFDGNVAVYGYATGIDVNKSFVRNAIFNAFYPVADANLATSHPTSAIFNAAFPVSDLNIAGTTYTKNAIFNAFYPIADANLATSHPTSAIFNAAFPISDLNISGTTYTKNAIFNAFYPIADANISSAASWNARVQNAIFNAFYPVVDGNVTNALTIVTSNDINYFGTSGILSNTFGSFDSNAINFQIARVTKATLATDGNLGIGTTTPSNTLKVVGDINVTGLSLGGRRFTGLTVDGSANQCLITNGAGVLSFTACGSGGGGGGRTYTSGSTSTIQVNNDLNTLSQNFDGNFYFDINRLIGNGWADGNVSDDLTINTATKLIDTGGADLGAGGSEISIGVSTRAISIAGGSGTISVPSGSTLTLNSGTGSVQFTAGTGGVSPSTDAAMRLGSPSNRWGKFFIGDVILSDALGTNVFAGDMNVLLGVKTNKVGSFDANTLSLQTKDTDRLTIASDGNVAIVKDLNVQAGGIAFGGLTLRFPKISGTSGQALTSDGAGGVSWSTISGSGCTTCVQNAIFNAFYPVADANITAVSTSKFIWDSNTILDSRYTKNTAFNSAFPISDLNISGTTYTKNAIFNAAYPWVDGNVANNLTITTSNDINSYAANGILSNNFGSVDANTLNLLTNRVARIIISSTGLIGLGMTPTYAIDGTGSTGVRFSTGVAGRNFFINTDGNIGINSLTPRSSLDINGDLNVSNGRAFFSNTLILPTGAKLCSGSDSNCFFPNAGTSVSAGVSTIAASGNAKLTGDVNLTAGTNITLGQSGQVITINSTASGGGTDTNTVTAGFTNSVGIFTGIDLNASSGVNTGVSLAKDANRICFPANTCEMKIDYNGNAFVFGG